VEHRLDAPELFDEEFRAALVVIRETPGAGARWPTPKHPGLRRVQMPRTRNHLYYYLDERRMTVVVLAVWGAPRGRAPRL
jgi:hypothetical protein